MSNKEPWLAVNLSILFPGMGQVYAGETLRGLILMFLQVGLMAIAAWSLFSSTGNTVVGGSCLLPILIIYIAGIFDAHTCVFKQMRDRSLEKIPRINKDPWFAVFLSLLFPGLGQLYIDKILPATWFSCLTIILSTLDTIFPNLIIFIALISTFSCYHAYMAFTHPKKPLNLEVLKIIFIGILTFKLIINYYPIWLSQQIEIFTIPSESMLPTLEIGDRIIVNKSKKYTPTRGDLIVFVEPESAKVLDETYSNSKKNHFFIKRVIGESGEIVEINDGTVYVNSQPLEEAYIAEAPAYKLEPSLIPSKSYIVLGDNRNKSFDSHVWGFLPKGNIVGKAYKIYWPPERIRPLLRNG